MKEKMRTESGTISDDNIAGSMRNTRLNGYSANQGSSGINDDNARAPKGLLSNIFYGIIGGLISICAVYSASSALGYKMIIKNEDIAAIINANRDKRTANEKTKVGNITYDSRDGIYFLNPEKMVVGIDGNNSTKSYFSADIGYAVMGKENLEALNELKPKINEVVQIYLSNLNSDDIDGALDMYRIKTELLKKCNAILSPYFINDVLITNFIIQK